MVGNKVEQRTLFGLVIVTLRAALQQSSFAGVRMFDYDGLYRLLAGVYKQALRDARQGHTSAINFLDYSFPEWRQWDARQPYQRARQPYKQRRKTKAGG